MSRFEAAQRRQPRRLRLALALLALFLLWFASGVYHGGLADRALYESGFSETSTTTNLWHRSCPWTGRETVFWGQGPGRPEAQGYVCTRLLGPAEVRLVPFEVQLGLDSHA